MTVKLRREIKPGRLACDLNPGDVVFGNVIQRVERRTTKPHGDYVAVFYTSPNHVGRHKKASCSLGVTAEELFEPCES